MIWMLPSAIALLIKGFLFFYSDVHKKKYFFIFLLSTFCLNLLELIAFFRFGYDLITLKLYYCAAIFTVFYLAVVCSDITQKGRFMKSGLALAAVFFLAAAVLLTDHIVKGVQLLPNGSITRIAGPYYFIFQLYALATLILSISLLTSNLFLKKDYHLKGKSLVALIGFAPFIGFILILIPLMQMGYNVNMAGFSSLSISIMLIFFISVTDKYKLFTIMQFLPFTHSRAQYLEIKSLLNRRLQLSAGDMVDMKGLLKEFEMLIIKHTHHYSDSQKETARRLNISESNLSRKIEK